MLLVISKAKKLLECSTKKNYKKNQKEFRVEKVIIEKKITNHDLHGYITNPLFIKLTAENFAARLAQANLASKSDIANFVKKTDFDDKLKNLNKKVTSNKTKHLLVENELKKLQTFDSYFNNNEAQFYSISQSVYKTITTFSCLPDTISNLNLLIQQIKAFLQNWYGIILE